MEQQNLTEDPYAAYEKEAVNAGKFFSPARGVSYKVVLADFELTKKVFKKGDTEKWAIVAKFVSVDGQPNDKEWSSSSATIIKALKPYHKNKEALRKVLWLLKKGGDENKTTYIFEDIGRVGEQSPAPSEKEAYA